MDWVSIGLDPEICTFFIQSHIKEHAELHLIFSMITPLPWLERNPTYKEQMQELSQKDLYTYGFLGYPVLQAADILMYKANGVPVGEDQAPHVEMTREIARRFNHLYKEVFPIPDVLLAPTSKLLGIDRRKMSKSYNNAIFLTDTDDEINRKVGQMITDPQRKTRTDPGNPKIFTTKAVGKGQGVGLGLAICKKIMAENLINALATDREKRRELGSDVKRIKDIIDRGNKKARSIAKKTMTEVKEAVRI